MKLHLHLVLLPLSIGKEFPTPNAHCFDQDATMAIDTNRKWKNTGGDQSKGLCYDTEGLAYNVDAVEDECCGCLHFRCSSGYCDDPGSRPYNYTKWVMTTVDTACCQDCTGAVYPQNEIVKKTNLNDECDTVKTDICKLGEIGYADDSTEEANNKETSKLVTTFEVLGCCVDSDGISPLNTSKVNLQTCSVRTCTEGRPSVWVDNPVYPGICNCCEYEGELRLPGWTISVDKQFLAVCHEGEILYRKKDTEEGGGGNGITKTTTTTTKKTTTTTTTSAAINQGQCSEPYTVLDSVWRKVDYTPGGAKSCDYKHCDQTCSRDYCLGFTEGWYRFVEPAGVSLPIAPPVMSGNGDFCEVCQTLISAWIVQRRHPAPGELMNITVNWAWGGQEKYAGRSTEGQAVACTESDKQYYLYRLKPAPGCHSGYCAIGA